MAWIAPYQRALHEQARLKPRRRKRHLLVDTLGMVVARRVEAANVSDRQVGARLLCRLTIRLPVDPDGDGRCRLREPQAGARSKTASRVVTAHHQTPASRLQRGGPDLDRGAHVCVAGQKSSSKDYELKVQTSEVFIDLAAIRLMLKRLAPR